MATATPGQPLTPSATFINGDGDPYDPPGVEVSIFYFALGTGDRVVLVDAEPAETEESGRYYYPWAVPEETPLGVVLQAEFRGTGPAPRAYSVQTFETVEPPADGGLRARFVP